MTSRASPSPTGSGSTPSQSRCGGSRRSADASPTSAAGNVEVAVRAVSVYSVAGQPQWVGEIQIAVTDDRGAYRITGLDPGNYVVSVLSVQTTVLDTTPEVAPRRAVGELESGGYGINDGPLMTPAIDVDAKHRLAITYFAAPPPPSGDSTRAYPAMFYPTATTIAAADPIPLTYGDSKTNVDFSLRPVPTFRVSGRLDAAGAAPPPFLLRLMPQGSERLGSGSEAATSIVEPDGSFTFLNVPNGQYTFSRRLASWTSRAGTARDGSRRRQGSAEAAFRSE